LTARNLVSSEGSLGRVTVDLARGLAAEGHSVHLITARPAARDRDGPVSVRDPPIDVLCVPLWTCEGALATLDSRYPTVVSCMTSMRTTFALHPEWRSHPDKQQRMALERATVRRARCLHGLTDASLRDCLAQYGPSPAITAVIPRGLVDRAGQPSQPSSSGPVEVLFVGRLEHRKGVDVLLDAARALIAEGMDAHFTLVGYEMPVAHGGVDLARVRGHGADRGWAGRVTVTGAVSDEQLDRHLQAADIVCVPSRYESHSVVLVEAMMFGKPVVACRTGGIPEVVQHAGNALLTPPGDAIALAASLRRLIEDRELRIAFGQSSRRRFEERFAIGVVAPRMASLFAGLAREHARVGEREHAGEGDREHVRVVGREHARESPWTTKELLVHRQACREWTAEAALELDLAYQQRQAWAERAAELDRVAQAAEQDARELRQALEVISRSRSWRLTGPLRRAVALGRASLRRP
jgi:glycosyltransferase involved in cell wall biosynthesis